VRQHQHRSRRVLEGWFAEEGGRRRFIVIAAFDSRGDNIHTIGTVAKGRIRTISP